ncbi:hypothetical protein ABW20_dc0101855 [Dactylellina cionopaga]|nr:hypothetical protein ABW20_dc0101855 [Dactylellina cionopaga]
MLVAIFITLAASLVSAAPVPQGQVAGGVIVGVGLVCAFQSSQCQAAGDAVRNAATDTVGESGNRIIEGSNGDGGMGSGFADAMSGAI